MAVNTPENPLLVFEYGGTARSGKGTIVSYLGGQFPNVATEETGADYRVITSTLLDAGELEPDMPDEAVERVVGRLSIGQLADMVAARPQIVAARGLDSLYTPEVTGIVSSVSPIQVVRKAVKAGFVKRVEAVADDESHSVLLVDGRNLAPVVSVIPRTELVMRTFVRCSDDEAARREVARNGLTGDRDAFRKSLADIKKRNYGDATRKIDPVKPDTDAIDYWGQEAFNLTTRHIADFMYDGDLTKALCETSMGAREYTDVVRYGIGRTAALSGRQVIFDTTDYRTLLGSSRQRMLDSARRMFTEALGAYNEVQHRSQGLATVT